LRVAEEDQGHAVTGGQAYESILRDGTLKFRSAANHLLELVNDLLLRVSGKTRVGDNVHEEDIAHFKRGVA
jgi:hypothetical protein